MSPSKAIFILAVMLGFSNRASAQDLVYFVEMNTFFDSEAKPYVELNLDINAYSVAYVKGAKGEFEGEVHVHYEIVSKEDPSKKVYEREFDLLSPPVTDTSVTGTAFGILDFRRVSLEPGNYLLQGQLKDNNRSNGLQHRFTKEFFIEAQPSDKMSFSSVSFIQSMTPTTQAQPHSKHGFDILPLVNDGNFVNPDSLRYYVETYHSTRQTQKVYFVNAYLSEVNSTSKYKNYSQTKRLNAKPLDIVTGAFNIRTLPTGTYLLNFDAYNSSQELVAKTSRKFYVINLSQPVENKVSAETFAEYFDMTEKDLDYYIRTVRYISTTTEQEFAEALSTLSEKQNFFYNFWEKRKERSTDPPSKPWLAYKARIDYANEHYRAAKYEGWRTDQGRVLLTWGPPNDIERYPSSNTMHPHEIWRYNKITTQANVRFVFYNPNLATNEMVLLHSDLRGERNNPRYEFDLVRSTVDGNLDVNTIDGQKQR